MPGLAQRGRTVDGRLDVTDRGRRVRGVEGRVGEGEVGPFPGPQHLPLTALPGLEAASGEHPERDGRAVGVDEQLAVLHGQVVAGHDQLGALLQSLEAVRGGRSDALEQLVALEHELGVAGDDGEGSFVRGRGRLRIVLVVERADGQVAPDHRVGRVELGRAAPVAYRVVGPVVGVAPVAEQGGGGRVVRIGAQRGLEGGDVVESGGEVPRPVARCGAPAGRPRRLLVTAGVVHARRRGSRRAARRRSDRAGGGHRWLRASSSSSRASSSSPIRAFSRATSSRVCASACPESAISRPARCRAQMSSGSVANVSASARSASSIRPSRRSSTTRRLRAWLWSGRARSAASTRLEGQLVAVLPGVDDRQLMISARDPGVQPGRLGEGRVRLVGSSEPGQRQPEQIVRLADHRVRVQAGQPIDGRPQVVFGVADSALRGSVGRRARCASERDPDRGTAPRTSTARGSGWRADTAPDAVR